MINELLIGLVTSLVYDVVKKGSKLVYTKFVSKVKESGYFITDSDFRKLFQIYISLVDNIQRQIDYRFDHYEILLKKIEDELLSISNTKNIQFVDVGKFNQKTISDIVNRELQSINHQNESRKCELIIEQANSYYNNEVFDTAIKKYEEARHYIYDNQLKYKVLWKIFSCYMHIANYYVSLYQINNQIIDLKSLLNMHDNNIGRASKSLKNLANITYNYAYDILNSYVYNSSKYAKLRRLGISKKGYEIGLSAINIAKQYNDANEMEKVYEILHCVEI